MNIKKLEYGVYRGSSPTTAEDRGYIKSLGIEYVLDLQTGCSILDDGSPLCEAEMWDEYGIRTYSHPLGAILPPTDDELREAFWMLITTAPIFVHCKTGVDRTGMVIAYWRIKYWKWSVGAAVAEMKAMGMHPWYYWWAWRLENV